jgi:hypothetical protein
MDSYNVQAINLAGQLAELTVRNAADRDDAIRKARRILRAQAPSSDWEVISAKKHNPMPGGGSKRG